MRIGTDPHKRAGRVQLRALLCVDFLGLYLIGALVIKSTIECTQMA
jgi:hypothetical protein